MDKLTNKDENNFYIQHVGLYFFFTACAGVSIIVWIFNWVCWINQCCCCDFLHNPVNKRIAWWMSFTFLLGMLACCIAGCVSVNRFGFALEGAWCAIDRIYYDSENGELMGKPDDMLDPINYKRWKGNKEEEYKDISNYLKDLKSKFENLNFDFNYYGKVVKGCLKILSMIYFCLLLIVVTFAGVSLMFYACLKRQGYLIMFMHVLWNVMRFFMFSFFFYGTTYGICHHLFFDMIGLVHYIFTGKADVSEFIDTELKGCFLDQDQLNLNHNNFCRVIRRDVNILFWALDDASYESRILSALSLCLSFFGAVAVYFYLLVMHHYNNEIFFDSGKSIFTGMEGFGSGYRKRNLNQDPAFKKRKLRSEIEMTSNNEQNNNYKDINKNDNEDD